MTAQRVIQKPVDGRLIIDVPKEFQNETLLITFEPTKETETSAIETEKRLEILRRSKGIFAESNYEPTENEWYEQFKKY